MNIILVDELPFSLLSLLQSRGHRVIQGKHLSEEEILELSSSCDTGLIIRSRFAVNADFLCKRPHRIRFVARFGAGLENIDVALCKKLDIRCYHSPQGNRDAVGDHALGLLLSISKNISKSFFEVRQGLWQREVNRGWEIGGKTIGILGFGNTGSCFGKRLAGFDCTVLAYDKYLPAGYAASFPHIKESNPNEIFQEADILSLHLPLTTETNGLVNDDFMNQFRKPICLINTSRGKIVKTAAVIGQLRQGRLNGFAADVLDQEALSFEKLEDPGSSMLSELLEFSNVVITPHIAGWSFESNQKMSEILAEQICRDFPT